jgi:hypothetical protein
MAGDEAGVEQRVKQCVWQVIEQGEE